MKLTFDTDAKQVTVDHGGKTQTLELYSAEAFDHLAKLWTTTGWGLRYSYGFTWLGRPLIQLPEDIVRIQEVIWSVKPDVIIETGVAHGGSLIFYASLFKALGKGRVVGVDIEIRPHNRKAIEEHALASSITLIEGSSTDAGIVARVREQIRPGEKVLVILDSNHSKAHVAAELVAYAPFVTQGSYIVATDGVMEDLMDVPGGHPSWNDDNPASAAREFAKAHPEFELALPKPPFDDTKVKFTPTYWPSAYLRRR